MKSAHPKVLHQLGGRQALMQHVLDPPPLAGAERTIVVTGHGAAEEPRFAASNAIPDAPATAAGGAPAVLQAALPTLDMANNFTTLVILNGDVPLITPGLPPARWRNLRRQAAGAAHHRAADPPADRIVQRPTVVRGDRSSRRTPERGRSADPREVYTGMMAARPPRRWRW